MRPFLNPDEQAKLAKRFSAAMAEADADEARAYKHLIHAGERLRIGAGTNGDVVDVSDAVHNLEVEEACGEVST